MLFSSDKKHTVSISPSIVIFTFLFSLVVFFLFQIKGILTALFLAFIIMTALRPAVDKLNHKYKIPRALSIFIVYLLVIFVLGLMVAVVLPPLLTEAYKLLRSFQLPFLQQEIKDLSLTVQEVSTLLNQVGDGAGLIISLITSTFSGVFALFTLMVMSFYIMLDRPNLHKKVSWFSKDKNHLKIAEDFLFSVEHQLGGWIRGQFILMLTIGVVTYIGLLLLQIPFALPLAIIAGLLEILPNLGPTIAAIPAVVLAFLTGGPIMGGVMIIFYLLVQQFENNLLVPKIMQANADVNPLIAIVTVLTGFQLAGVIGALLSIPFYIVLRTTYSMLKKHNVKLF
ncbi:MAG: AI-2E family transporter [Candidatus Pacebacteria bacterium]|nr:AI-2E family transporter [Candidatus Paceibacterota bacterium]